MPSRRLDEPQVDPESQAELPDETPDVSLLPSWMRWPAPRLLPPLPLRKAEALSELAEAQDGPAPELAEVLPPEEPGEMDWEALPRWMRGLPGHGPPEQAEREAASGAVQEDRDELPPEE